MTKYQFVTVLLLHAMAVQFATAGEPLVVPVSGKLFPAKLVAVDADWRLVFQVGGEQYAMRAADLVCWGQCPEQGRGAGIVLADGSWLAAEAVAADGETLSADSEGFGTLKIPLNVLAGVLFRSTSNRSRRDELFDRLVGATGQSDLLLLDNGDELNGQFLALADDIVQFQTDIGPIDVKTDRITALIFQRAENHKPNGSASPLQAWTGFRDGSRLLATRLVTEDDTLQITASGQPLAASQSSLVFLQPLGGRVMYLSDLEAAAYRQTPYLNLPWPYHTDRNVTGGFLRCDGRLYLKGLGVHSAARLVYKISPLPKGEGQGVRAFGAPKRFQADLGIDDSTGGRGSVQFRVLVDGRVRYASPIIRGGQPPTPISVDIRGVRKLELLVDYADRADVLDRANWLNARLTK